MKTTLLFTKNSKLGLALLVFCLCLNFGYSQTELVKNGTCDEHGTGIPETDTSDTSDNADAWDMTPNSTLNGGITSPYRYDEDDNPDGWRNDALETYIEDTYTTDPADEYGTDEQPGSTSNGNNDTRGVKLYDDADGKPVITQSTRRLYQRVVGLTIGSLYNFSIDSKSEAAGTPSEVYILNTQITTEAGINANGYTDGSVVAGMNITNDEDAWVTNTLTFTATTTEVVIYVRSINSIDKNTEVFYDNISLKEDVTNSIEDNELSKSFNVYPNPANGVLFIKSNQFAVSNVAIFNVMGQKVLEQQELENNQLDVSSISKGMYILKVTSDSKSFTKKIIIE
ncbi:T9SS type A sorting domain-containing protein [Lutibacter sp. TH_r2]|uniref:T9SS type A sorting domain-containing protein n=1 Tax=Lutibacter sp. TH_r2 TaxID=3082083 RepID=UPI002954FE93|nr:T9SS type A sorting domain-containing protein [Lutibacter sp. TH_r2]MDV7186449.1 T9SS type A sorting domain-containing protein [Lutibacter sp. TH_r2]